MVAALSAATTATAAPYRGAARSATSHRPAYGTLYVSSGQPAPDILEFAPNVNGNFAPESELQGSPQPFSQIGALAISSGGNLWVDDRGAQEIYEYAPGAHGAATPILTLGPSKYLDEPADLAIAPDGSLWVLDEDFDSSFCELYHFAKGAKATSAPIGHLIPNPTCNESFVMALADGGKKVWLGQEADSATSSPAALHEYSTAHSGFVTALATITGSRTTIDDPVGLAVDSVGDVIVSSERSSPALVDALLTFKAGAHGNVAPIQSAVAVNTTEEEYEVGAVARDAVGNIWQTDPGQGTLFQFGPKANGDVTPSRYVGGLATTLDAPQAIAVYAAAPGAPKAVKAKATSKHKLALSWQTPAITGGAVQGYVVLLRSTAAKALKVVGLTSKHSFTTAKLAKGKKYVIRIEAYNAIGIGAESSPHTAKVK
jgi:hypothetical protein